MCIRDRGVPILRAALEGAVSRLRPILMTSFAFIAGLVPLVVASGAGALGNRSIGTAAAGGMLIGTLFGLLLIPGLYVLFARIGQRFGSGEKPTDHHEHKQAVSPNPTHSSAIVS